MSGENNLIDNLRSEAFKIEDLVDYQSDSIVSKTMIDKDSGTITLFAFDKGQTMSEHTAPFDALVKILEGKAEVIISDKKLELEGGESTVIPSGEPHSLKAVEKFKMFLVIIR